jgi:CBS-domain-containing membrane protein
MDTLASQLMDPEPTTLRPTDTIEFAADCVMRKRYRSLPVVDENGCYLGIFGVNCLLKQVIPKAVFMKPGLENIGFIHESLEDLHARFDEVKHEPISICMNRDIQTITPDAPLTETLLQLYNTRMSIPVVEANTCKLLGMISYWDVGRKILAAAGHRDA